MKFILTLHVFEIPEDKIEAQNCDILIPLEECFLNEYTFYNIDCISTSGDTRFCVVSTNGIDYTVNKTYKEVKKLIQDQLRKDWN